MSKCGYETCDREIKLRGLCKAHYSQQARGKKLAPLRRTDERKLSIKQRIKNNVEKDKNTKCWNWQLAKTDDGYGTFSHHGKMLKAHRVAYEAYVGPLERGTVVHHKCSNRACVNPRHLQSLSPQENGAEMYERQQYIKKIKELEERIAKYELQEVSETDGQAAV